MQKTSSDPQANDCRAAAKPSSDDRRAAKLAVAREAFLRDGFAAASMSEIAATIGGSKATLYSYFPSKRELFAAVIERECRDRFAPVFAFEVGESQGDLGEVLRRFARRFLDLLLADDMIAFYRLIIAESARFPEIGQATYQIGVQHGLNRLSEYFAAAMARGALRPADPTVAARQFLELCSGELHRKRLYGIAVADVDADADRQTRNTVSTFLAAFGADDAGRGD